MVKMLNISSPLRRPPTSGWMEPWTKEKLLHSKVKNTFTCPTWETGSLSQGKRYFFEILHFNKKNSLIWPKFWPPSKFYIGHSSSFRMSHCKPKRKIPFRVSTIKKQTKKKHWKSGLKTAYFLVSRIPRSFFFPIPLFFFASLFFIFSVSLFHSIVL